jgi:hypothetical protein
MSDVIIPILTEALGSDNETPVDITVHYAFSIDPLNADLECPSVLLDYTECMVSFEYECPLVGTAVLFRPFYQVQSWSVACAIAESRDDAENQAMEFFATISGYF